MKKIIVLFLTIALIVVQATNVCQAKPAVCDITNVQINEGDGYLATTTEVLGNKQYWKYYAEKSPAAALGMADDQSLREYAALTNNSAGNTAWILSDEAARMLKLADDKHRAWAKEWWASERTFLPPGNGLIDLQKANEAISNRNK